ncbi:MAG: FG-GAP-like repeat-containing protein, partial [Planctomycetia bacterium]|nr:FG-GAP-like repeat-containing protein [Planctomycetia bacterium]
EGITETVTPVFSAGETLMYGTVGGESPINVGGRATIELADFDSNGTMDLLVGALDGTIHVFYNSEESGVPQLTSTQVLQTAEGENVAVSTGRSTPVWMDFNGDGLMDIVSGNTAGQVVYWQNIGSRTTPKFAQETYVLSGTDLLDFDGDVRTRIDVADYDGDGIPDIVAGVADGNVYLFRGSENKPFSNEGESGQNFEYSFGWSPVHVLTDLTTVLTTSKNTYDTAENITIPKSANKITDWDAFYVELWKESTSLLEAGKSEIVTIIYDATLFTFDENDNDYGGIYTLNGISAEIVTHKTENGQGTLTIRLTVGESDFSVNGQHAFWGAVHFIPVPNLDTGMIFGKDVQALVTNTVQSAATVVTKMPYDLHSDGEIDIIDLVDFARQYGKKWETDRLPADFNNNGEVEILDLVLFARNYGISKNSDRVIQLPETNSQLQPIPRMDTVPQSTEAVQDALFENLEDITEDKNETSLTSVSNSNSELETTQLSPEEVDAFFAMDSESLQSDFSATSTSFINPVTPASSIKTTSSVIHATSTTSRNFGPEKNFKKEWFWFEEE